MKTRRKPSAKFMRRVAMLKAYAKKNNCTYGEAMKRTKGTKVDGGADGDDDLNPPNYDKSGKEVGSNGVDPKPDNEPDPNIEPKPEPDPNIEPKPEPATPYNPVGGGKRRTKKHGSRRHRKSYRKKSPTKRKLFGLW